MKPTKFIPCIILFNFFLFTGCEQSKVFQEALQNIQNDKKEASATPTEREASTNSKIDPEPSLKKNSAPINKMANQPEPITDLLHTQFQDYQLKPEWDPSNTPADFEAGKTVDINLGHTPANFIQAVCFQLTGGLLVDSEIQMWVQKMKDNPRLRRIDIAIMIANQLNLKPTYTYSDPWLGHPRFLKAPPIKKVKRELGAVCMYFFTCPGGINGPMSWSNNHAPGMHVADDICRIDSTDNGFYNPRTNAGFWFMELMDAHYAGLQFFLLNTYGPDIEKGDLRMPHLNRALEKIDTLNLENPVKLGLFDDTWSWGKPYFSDYWKVAPDFNQVEEAAKKIFEGKWKPFFQQIPKKYWYTKDGKPFIYFYNGGSIQNKKNSTPVFKRLKELFAAEFGVEPFIALDSAFWNSKDSREVVDQKFKWFHLETNLKAASYKLNDTRLTHTMVRWDSTSRENKRVERIGEAHDKLYKDDTLLNNLLDNTHDDDFCVIATWNDLGEGTGINRCYDYYWNGEWKRPTYFLEQIRKSQAGEMVSVSEE